MIEATNLKKNGLPVYSVNGYLVAWEKKLVPQAAGLNEPPIRKIGGWHIISKRFFTLYPSTKPRFGWEDIQGVIDFIETAQKFGPVFSE